MKQIERLCPIRQSAILATRLRLSSATNAAACFVSAACSAAPSFGRGPNKELWKIEQKICELLDACRQLLSDKPAFVLMTLYSLEQSSLLLANLLREMMRDFSGSIEIGELTLKPKASDTILPMSLFGRWASQ